MSAKKVVGIVLLVIVVVFVSFVIGVRMLIHKYAPNLQHMANTPTASSGAEEESQSQDRSGKALDDYIESYNKSINTFGFIEEYKNYRQADIAHANAHSSLSVSVGWIPQSLEQLKKARAESSGTSDLDKEADKLIASMEKVVTHLTDLESYYSSKAYIVDNLARGKKENAQMLQEFEAAHVELRKFDEELDKQIEIRDQVSLQRLKDKGMMVRYDVKLVLKQSDELVRMLRDSDHRKDQALFVQADVQVAKIEATLADLRLQVKKDKQAGKEVPTSADMVDSNLTDMVGSYRELKMKHDASDMHSVIERYNSAVDAANTWN